MSDSQGRPVARVSSGKACVLCGGLERERVFEVSLAEFGKADETCEPSGPRWPGEPPRHRPARTFALERCTSCELVMTEPRLEGPNLEAYYQSGYWGRANPCDLDWVRRDQRPRTAFLERFRKEGRLLDVGCGLGLFLLALDPARWDRYGLEVMPEAYRQTAQWLGANRVLRADLTAAALPCEHFDALTLWDVLEHLPNPCAALKEAYRLLRPGGVVLLRLPNFASRQARRFREDWYALSLPHHLYHFTPATLTRLLESSGFEIRALENCQGDANYHSLKHSLLNQMTRCHGPRGGRLRYYLCKPFLRPWEWIGARPAEASCLQVCAERPLADTSGWPPSC